MARLLIAGAESNDRANIEGFTTLGTGTLDIVTIPVYSGTYAFRANSAGTGDTPQFVYSLTTTNGTTYYVRIRFRTDTLPSASSTNNNVIQFISTASGGLGTIRVSNTDNKIRLFDNGGTQIGSDGPAVVVDTWYRIEASLTIGTGSVDTLELIVDGVTIGTAINQSYGDVLLGSIRIGMSGGGFSTANFYFDDIAVNDSTGGSQNSYPGDGRVVLALPISTNTAGNWTGGAGGTTNIWEAVNNTPPAGLGASPETDTSQIHNATNSTVGYTANLTTYATLGIASADTINCVQSVAVAGQDVTTGTRTGTQEMTSNPTIGTTAANFNEGGAATGTYPTGWAIYRGTMTYAPSVTVGSSPVMKFTKTDTGTREGDVCFMGLYIDYTPAAPAGRPLAFFKPVMAAVGVESMYQ